MIPTTVRAFAACLLLLATTTLAKVPISSRPTGPVDAWVQQVQLANSLMDAGNLDDAAIAYQSALDSAECDGDDLRIGVVLQNIGGLLDRRGLARQAGHAYLRAIQALERTAGDGEKVLVRAYVGLTTVYIQTGQYSKAETLIQRALAEHPEGAASDRASLMGSLGVVLTYKSRFQEAERLLRKTVELCAPAGSSEMQEVGAVAAANLAGLLTRAGRTTEALALYRQAIGMLEALPNPSPATLAATLADYAKALRGTGNRDTAVTLYRRSISLAEANLGQNHPVLGSMFQECAELLRELGRKSEARDLANAARRILRESSRENLTGHTVEFGALLADM